LYSVKYSLAGLAFYEMDSFYSSFVSVCETKHVPPRPKAGEGRNFVAESTGNAAVKAKPHNPLKIVSENKK